ncbi:MAG: ATP-binding protein [Leptospiraceae bacterium]|nr:ATP-binding protein [Leptospiraceae bacterium]
MAHKTIIVERSSLSKQVKLLPVSIRSQMIVYASRMLEQLEPDEDLIDFYFSLPDTADLEQLHMRVQKLINDEEQKKELLSMFRRQRFSIDWDDLHPETVAILLDETSKLLGEQAVPDRQNNRYQGRIRQLSDLLGLNSTEQEILQLLFTFKNSDSLQRIIRNREGLAGFDTLISILCQCPLADIRRALHKSSALTTMQVIENNYHIRSTNLELTDDTFNFILDLADENMIDSFFHLCPPASDFRLDSFPIAKSSRRILSGLAGSSGPAHILLWGYPGTGKTELCKSLLAELGETSLWISCPDHSDDENRRIRALIAACHYASQKEAVVVMDEADDFLATEKNILTYRTADTNKAWLNQFLDKNRKTRIIFISNRVDAIELSVRRRMHFNLFFDRPSEKLGQQFCKKAFLNHAIARQINYRDLAGLINQPGMSPATLGKALDTAQMLLNNQAQHDQSIKTNKMIKKIIHNHRVFMGEEKARSLSDKPIQLSARFRRKFLNPDTDLKLLQSSLKSFYRQNIKHSKKRKSKKQQSERGGLALLFHGPSGSGKSEYVRYLAKKIKAPLKYIQASDILAPLVGQNEQNLRMAFDTAAAEKSILFIDEIDTFLGNRQQSNRNWERNLVNEFLTNLENFSGILIATTNLDQLLDSAVSRRFSWKVHFGPLKPEHIIAAISQYFPIREDQIGPVETSAINKLDGLCIGDIRVVWNRRRFINSRQAEMQFTELVTVLQKEIQFRNGGSRRTLGFQ